MATRLNPEGSRTFGAPAGDSASARLVGPLSVGINIFAIAVWQPVTARR